jgi:hypothetical protein
MRSFTFMLAALAIACQMAPRPRRQESDAPVLVSASMVEEHVERLRLRVRVLEAQVTKLEGVARTMRAPLKPARVDLASGRTVVALFMLMLVSVSAAIVAVARVHRARLERSSLLALGAPIGRPCCKRPTVQT